MQREALTKYMQKPVEILCLYSCRDMIGRVDLLLPTGQFAEIHRLAGLHSKGLSILPPITDLSPRPSPRPGHQLCSIRAEVGEQITLRSAEY